MASNAIAEAFVTLRPDTSKFGGETQGWFSGNKAIFAAAGVAAGAAFAVAFAGKLKGFLSDAVGQASDLNETISKSNTIFGSNGAAIEKWAEGGARAFGQSKRQALDNAASFGNMFTQLGIGLPKATAMSTAMVELAGDFDSFHNPAGGVNEVLIAMQAAFRGEYDAVQRFVPVINAATVEQKALQMGLAGSTKELTMQDKALATQALLIAGAGAATGDFARTSGSLANSQRTAAGEADNLSAKLGNYLVPAVTALTRAKIELTGAIAQHVLPALERGAARFGEMARAVLENKPVVAGLATMLLVVLTPALLTAAVATAQLILRMDLLILRAILAAGPILAIPVAIGALVAGVVWLGQNWDAVWDRLPDGVQNALRAVKGFGEGFVNVMKTTINWFIDQLNKIKIEIPDWGIFGGMAGKTLEVNIPKVEVMFDALKDFAGNAINGVKGAIGGLVGALGGTAAAAAPAVAGVNQFTDAVAKSGEKAKTMADVLEQIEKDQLQRRIEAFLSGSVDLAEVVRLQNIGQLTEAKALAERLHEVFGVKLPDALETAMKHVVDSANAMAKAAEDAAKRVRSDAFDLTRTLWQQGGSGMSAATAAGLAALADAAARGRTGSVDAAGNFVPNVPGYDMGGVVPGRIGMPQLIMAHGGETVLPTHRGGGVTVVPIYIGGRVVENLVIEGIVTGVRRGDLNGDVLLR